LLQPERFVLSVTSIFKKKLKITKFETFQTCDAGASKNGPRERETNTKGYCIVASFREAMRTLGLEEKSAKLNKKETLGRSTPGLAPVESTAVENLSIQLRGYTKYIYDQTEDSFSKLLYSRLRAIQ
jgi:hypothetical protein